MYQSSNNNSYYSGNIESLVSINVQNYVGFSSSNFSACQNKCPNCTNCIQRSQIVSYR